MKMLIYFIINLIVYISFSIALFHFLPFLPALCIIIGVTASTIGIFLYMLEIRINK